VQDNKETAKLLGMNVPGKHHMEKMKKQLSEMMHITNTMTFWMYLE